MTPRGLLDISTLILLGRLDPVSLPDEPLIGTVTLAELAVGPLVADDDDERAARQAHLQQAESDLEPLDFDAADARAFGRAAASLRRNGRKPAARAVDAIIASVAVSRDLPVFTCHPEDFVGSPGWTCGRCRNRPRGASRLSGHQSDKRHYDTSASNEV